MSSDTFKDDWGGSKGKKIAEFIDNNKEKLGIKFKDATQIKPLDKLDLMAKVMKWVDSSISVTYLLPEDSDWKDVYNFILEANKREVKSIAAFPDKKMYGIISFIPFKNLAQKLIEEGKTIHPQNFSEDEIKELDIKKDHIKLHTGHSPKRPKELDADIYSVTAKGEKYVVTVGLYENQPYEIFGGHTNGINVTKTSKGKLIKKSRGKYSLKFDDIHIEDFSQQFTPTEQTLFRMASTMLRHGIPIEYIVEQMNKSSNDMFSLPSAISRVLKKYIKDGQKVQGQKCKSCESQNLIYMEGCVTCSDCEWSKCS